MLSGCRLEVFCHATEEEEKVLHALRNALPEKLRDKKADTEVLRGLYGNKILKFSLRLARRDSRDFVERLKSNLPEEDRKRLVSEASERIDGSGFFFRLDKQEAYHGRLKLAGSGGEDTIGVRLTIETFGEGKKVLEEIESMFLSAFPKREQVGHDFGYAQLGLYHVLVGDYAYELAVLDHGEPPDIMSCHHLHCL